VLAEDNTCTIGGSRKREAMAANNGALVRFGISLAYADDGHWSDSSSSDDDDVRKARCGPRVSLSVGGTVVYKNDEVFFAHDGVVNGFVEFPLQYGSYAVSVDVKSDHCDHHTKLRVGSAAVEAIVLKALPVVAAGINVANLLKD